MATSMKFVLWVFFILFYSSFPTWLEDAAKWNALTVNTKAWTFGWNTVGVPFKCFHVGVRHYKDRKRNRNETKWNEMDWIECDRKDNHAKVFTARCPALNSLLALIPRLDSFLDSFLSSFLSSFSVRTAWRIRLSGNTFKSNGTESFPSETFSQSQ